MHIISRCPRSRSRRACPPKHPHARRRGFTLIELMVAMVVLAIASVGTLATLLVIHQHNESSSEATLGYKACQEIMEQLVSMSYDNMKAQNNLAFAAKKLHPTTPIGLIQIVDVSPPEQPDTLCEIRVSIATQPGQVTLKPLNVEIVSWRTRK